MIKYEVHSLLPGFETNTYLVYDDVSLEAFVIDPAAPSEQLLSQISGMQLQVKAIINTHGHADHIGGNDYFHKQLNVPVYIHANDAGMLTSSKLNLSAYMEMDLVSPPAKDMLTDGSQLKLGEIEFTIFHTPGHTQGGICLYTKGLLFSGDTLFLMDIGRADLPGGNYQQLLASIKSKLFTLPDATLVLPGHGPASDIAYEKSNNPYFKG
jgi:glyoxylase-like metal-dependent hydrolase (beta-lactamase superfamily II)